MDARVVHAGFAKAVEFFGSQADLARALGVTPQAVTQWRERGFSPRSAVKLDRITAGALPAREMAADEEAHQHDEAA
ncbi:MAG: helix-turn-helix domain-containing protein [Burkholderiaceae bacterium]|jgi:DNA-binding transcriptional regulator YdaS (Cro superfamily)|nr:helix-turn-helix domain-containing protein [Burkholderiaceae bacterium]